MPRPTTLYALFQRINRATTPEAVDRLREAAVDIARAEGSPDPVEQAECWLADAPGYDDEQPDEPSPEEYRRMRALYEGEKAASLHKSSEEYEAELRDAGRGHLIRRD